MAVTACLLCEPHLDEDLGFMCSGLLGSRSFVFVEVCRHCITVLDGRLSPVFDRVPVDADRVCDRVFGADFALGLWRGFEDDADGFCFLSSSVVAESTEIVNRSSAVDSPAAGIATSPPPTVIVVPLDPDATGSTRLPKRCPKHGIA